MILLIVGCKAFHSKLTKTKVGVQDMISSFSFDQSLISSVQLKAEMSQEHYETNGTRNDSLNNENLMKDRERFLSTRRTDFIKTEVDLNRTMKRRIWSTIAITRDLIETLRRVMNVGSRSCGLDLIGDPSHAKNLSRYNNHDRRSGFVHLFPIWSTCLISWSRGPRVHAINVRDSSRSNPTHHNPSRVLKSNKRRDFSPTRNKLRGFFSI